MISSLSLQVLLTDNVLSWKKVIRFDIARHLPIFEQPIRVLYCSEAQSVFISLATVSTLLLSNITIYTGRMLAN